MDDEDDEPLPNNIHSAKALHDEMERRQRRRARKAQTTTVAGTILPEAMPPARSITDLISRPNPLAHLDGLRLAARGTLGETLNSVSSVAPSIQQTSIKNLEPLFKSFTVTEVSVYAMDEQPIGPRIGVPDVPEPTLKALASFEVQRRGRRSDRRWHIVAGGLAAFVAGVVAWILRGVLGV